MKEIYTHIYLDYTKKKFLSSKKINKNYHYQLIHQQQQIYTYPEDAFEQISFHLKPKIDKKINISFVSCLVRPVSSSIYIKYRGNKSMYTFHFKKEARKHMKMHKNTDVYHIWTKIYIYTIMSASY